MKKRIAVFFGGRSAEYAVSLRSAAAVLRALSSQKYDIFPVGITRAGAWHLTRATPDEIEADAWQQNATPCLLSPDREERGLWIFEDGGACRQPIDLLLPVTHGTYGEDGCLQGLFALSGIPHVGCGVRASAVGMDKALTKTLCASHAIPTLPFVLMRPDTPTTAAIGEAEERLSYPLFVKPVTGGSSVGTGLARDRAELCRAISIALPYGPVMIEPFTPARELEVAVTDSHADGVGEIDTGGADFYDYQTKYEKLGARLVIPAPVSPRVERAARAYAEQIYRLLDCRGGVRVDFFLSRADGRLYFNEINTLPGFTDISMYPRLAAQGGSLSSLLDRLVTGAFSR
ncbi:MAG: D-alanine--D-alanine ligase [Clostridia bacterium]|nr:D-alanine--D-alanine ligase [Clostridia bacterium]